MSKYFRVTGELSGFGEQRNRHENRIAHLVVIRHRFLHRAGLGEPRVCGLANKLRIARIPCLLRKLGKYEMAGKRQRIRAGEIVAAIEVPCGKLHDLRCIAEAQLADERHSRKIGKLVEVVSVNLCQFIGKLPWRTRLPTLEFSVRLGDEKCRTRPRSASPSVGVHVVSTGSCRYRRPAFCDSACTNPKSSPTTIDKVRRMNSNPSPEYMRLGILAIGDSAGRKLKAIAFRIGQRNRDKFEGAANL